MPFVGLGVGVGRQRFRGGFVGLLDTYSGAAAAYSLRQLSSTYSGDSIRVRRASDNAESDIGFVSGQLDTSTLETFCSGTDGFVTTWYDQSGNGNNATQSTSANQPQIVSSGSTITENGKPAIDFDGSNDYLEKSTFSLTQPFTTINVTTTNTALTGQGIISINDDKTSLSEFADFYRSDNSFATYSGTSLSSAPSVLYNTGSQYIKVSKNNGASSEIYVNNSLVASGNQGSSVVSGDLYLGTYFIPTGQIFTLDGTIQEIIIYNSDQSSNRTGIESNINDFYNIY